MFAVYAIFQEIRISFNKIYGKLYHERICKIVCILCF